MTTINTGDTIRYSSDAEVASLELSYVKLKTLTMTDDYTGNWRIKFDLSGDNVEAGDVYGYGRIYKNGVAYGTEMSKLAYGFQTFSEDFTSISIANGDTIELWAKLGSRPSYEYVYVRNFRIMFDPITAWLTGWDRRKSQIINGSTAGLQTNYQIKLDVIKGSPPPSPISGWTYVDIIQIDNTNNTNALIDYQISTTIDTASLISQGKMQSDGRDIRCVDSDGITILNYWIEKGINTTSTKIWVKVPSIPASSKKSIYLEYGNPAASPVSNGDNTFDFFDDFPGTSIDITKWTITDATGWSVSGGELQGTNTTGILKSIPTFSSNVIQDVKSRYTAMAANGFQSAGFFISTSNGFGLLQHPSNDFYRNDGVWTGISATSPSGTNLLTKITTKPTTVDLNVTNYDTGATYQNYVNVSNTVSSEPITIGRRYDNALTGQGYNGYWDWIRIRKYTSPEPTTGYIKSENAVYVGTSVRDDFGDIRFTTSDGQTLLNYWIESYTAGSIATFWIKIDSIPASPGTSTIYIYYDNPSQTTTSNGPNTFIYFEDFSTNPTSQWTWTNDYNNPAYTLNGYLGLNIGNIWNGNSHIRHNTLNTGNGSEYYCKMNPAYYDAGQGGAISWYIRYDFTTNNGYRFWMGNYAYYPTNNIRLWRVDSGVYTTLGQTASNFTINQYHKIRIVFNNAGINVYMNDVLILSVVDDGKTYSGTMQMDEVRSHGNWDDIRVKKSVSPEPTFGSTGAEELHTLINGTFGTDLSGWTPTISGDADAIWENSGSTPGRAKLRIYRCANSQIRQIFVVDNNRLRFDWETLAENWYEAPMWKLTLLDGTIIINEGLPIGQSVYNNGTRIFDVSPYIGQGVSLTFYIAPSAFCSMIDHANTYLWVDNVALIVPAIDALLIAGD